MAEFHNNAIFWIDLDKIHPNPYQPRREFDMDRLSELAESIRQYGVLQPIVVSRMERIKEDGGLIVEYELIAGERRHRASRLAGLSQIPAIIRTGTDDARVKLELAIIENLQREDLNAIDRARAFKQLVEEFGFKHGDIGGKVGKSREYVSNTIRLLTLPEEIQNALVSKKINEGHTRPLMMLNDRPAERDTLYKEIILKKITVREAEQIARRIAQDKIRKIERKFHPEIIEIEKELSESFGTRVQIQSKEVGGKVIIDFFTDDDLKSILLLLKDSESGKRALASMFSGAEPVENLTKEAEAAFLAEEYPEPEKITFISFPFSTDIAHFIKAMRAQSPGEAAQSAPEVLQEEVVVSVDEPGPRREQEVRSEEKITLAPSSDERDDLYSIRNFTL